ncbi:MAG: hypothetical protein FJ284_16265 [Planctomycetes bacterium]|nr:hypothetical protein [Planctomycetota bacterium]
MESEIAGRMDSLAADNALPDATRQVAAELADVERSRSRCTIDPNAYSPDAVAPIDDEFADLFAEVANEGAAIAGRSSVVFVGMARDIGGILPATIERLERIAVLFKSWGAVVVENDSTDDTKDVLRDWSQRQQHVVADCRDLGYERLAGFEATRVERYADLRSRYRDIAVERFPAADFVIAVDLDPWGGYSLGGVANSIGWLARIPRSACMASTSLFQARTADGSMLWLHYDQWAFRAHGFRQRWERHFPSWIPPPGAPPIRVLSAFGALAVYRAEAFYAHRPHSIAGDIEHVGLHRSMIEDGWGVYLNPASRVVMHWVAE